MNASSFVINGFEFCGVSANIKQSGQPDLGVILCTNPKTTAAGLFTTNDVKAAPVLLCRKHIRSKHTRLVLVNAGNANAATGAKGLKDAETSARLAAKKFNFQPSEVLVSSTGKIGVPLPLEKITTALNSLTTSEHELDAFTNAIMTTDQYPKLVTHEGMLDKKNYRIAIIAKGAGMISPNMATFLCYIVTDLKISKPMAQQMLKEASENTLNAMTVDGDMSTNDTAILLASQMADNAPITKKNKAYTVILHVLTKLLGDIVQKVCLDGEGATKCFRTTVINARSTQQAKTIALSVANSQLVKTAMFGCDPNWGRILCASGYCGAKINPDKANIKLGDVFVFKKGVPQTQNESAAAVYLRNNQLIDVEINLNQGTARAKSFASDLTYEYVRINAEYST